MGGRGGRVEALGVVVVDLCLGRSHFETFTSYLALALVLPLNLLRLLRLPFELLPKCSLSVAEAEKQRGETLHAANG